MIILCRDFEAQGYSYDDTPTGGRVGLNGGKLLGGLNVVSGLCLRQPRPTCRIITYQIVVYVSIEEAFHVESLSAAFSNNIGRDLFIKH